MSHEAPGEWEPDYGPCGPIGREVALGAELLREHFSHELDWVPGAALEWEATDYDALEIWLNLETGFPLLEIPWEMLGEDRQRVHDTITRFHTALPFNEAERAWLEQLYKQPRSRGTVSELPGMFEAQAGRILVAGIHRPVSGHDLMSRWLAWRRQTDEYRGQGSLELACQALAELQEQMS